MRNALEDLGAVARDIVLVERSRSATQRSSALNRASGALRGLWTEASTPLHSFSIFLSLLQGDRASGDAPTSPSVRLTDWPEPERGVINRIARQWLAIVLRSAIAVGTLEVREPVASPYIAGASVPAQRMAGRRDIFDQITAAWAKPRQRDSLVIYGHRRMGKTSIARNLLHFCRFGPDTGLAFLNLQAVALVSGASRSLLCDRIRSMEGAASAAHRTARAPCPRISKLTPGKRCAACSHDSTGRRDEAGISSSWTSTS